jgi:hypothetical protein
VVRACPERVPRVDSDGTALLSARRGANYPVAAVPNQAVPARSGSGGSDPELRRDTGELRRVRDPLSVVARGVGPLERGDLVVAQLDLERGAGLLDLGRLAGAGQWRRRTLRLRPKMPDKDPPSPNDRGPCAPTERPSRARSVLGRDDAPSQPVAGEGYRTAATSWRPIRNPRPLALTVQVIPCRVETQTNAPTPKRRP